VRCVSVKCVACDVRIVLYFCVMFGVDEHLV